MHRSSLVTLLTVAVLVLAGCSEDPTPVEVAAPDAPPASAEDIAKHLESAYRAKDPAWFASLLAHDPELPTYRFTLGPTGCPYEFWGRDEELAIHAGLFGGDPVIPEPPAVGQFVITTITITLTRQTEFIERTDLYQSALNPQGIDPMRFEVVDATYEADLLLQTDGENEYLVQGELELVLAVDLQKEAGEAGKVVILEWHDLGSVHKAEPSPAAVVPATWALIKSFYRSQSPEHCPATSAEELIQDLASAYSAMDWQWLESLLADDAASQAEYLFTTPPESGVPGGAQWGFTEEVRIHQRMFEPQNTPPGQTPVPAPYWPTAIYITLTQETAFEERPDLYVSTQNPNGLSPLRWKAADAVYRADVLWDLQGDIDYQVTGQELFVVIEDRHKSLGAAGKFLILQWEELITPNKSSVEGASWGAVKSLYK